METIAGIDLGTTNSLIGVVDSGFPILIADEDGSRLTPSVVYQPENGDPLVGRAALRMQAIDPARTVVSVKRHIGGGTSWNASRSPEEISAEILRHLKSVAERAIDQQISKAVITVPAYFNDNQRAATKRAGELAGFEVERILNEPTAAALAYGLDKRDGKSTIAVYDFGGGTFDLSILELNSGVFQVLSTNGDTRLGGDDIDQAFAAWLWNEGQLPGEFDDQEIAVRVRVLDAVRDAKIQLSSDCEVRVSIPFVLPEHNLDVPVSVEQFESIAKPVIDRTRGHCVRAMSDAGLDPDAIDEVVLVGGSTRIPAVRELARQVFKREPNLSQHPDEAIAMGATIQAGILSGALRDLVLLDVTPLSLGIETFGGLMNVIIPRNTTIPAKAGEMFTNAVNGQESMRVRILQGEREMARDNWELGLVDVPFEKGPKGSARVGVQFEIDENGILTVLARDTKTMTDHRLEIQSAAVDVNDENVEQMISESVEHAFGDMSERILTEAKLKAEELLPAVREAMVKIGDSLSSDETAAVESGISAVEKAMTGKDVQALKSATADLDRLTEPMAALLVEKALAEALARKGID